MAIINAVLLLITLFTFGLGILVLIRSQQNVRIPFSLLIFAGALWSLSIAAFRASTNSTTALFWNQTIYLCGTSVASLFLWFSLTFSSKEKPKLIKAGIAAIPFIIFTPIIFTSKLFIKSVILNSRGNSVQLGPIYRLWTATFILTNIFSFLILLRQYQHAKGVKKSQLKFILLSIIPPLIGSNPTNIILPLFGNYQLIWIGPLSITLMMAIITYAILKHRFLDTRIMLQQIVVKLTTGLFFSLILTYSLFIYYLLNPKNSLKAKTIAISILSGIITAFIYPPLAKLSQNLTNNLLFKNAYDPQKLLKKLNKILTGTIGFDNLLAQLSKTLKKGMNLQFASIILFTKNKNDLQPPIKTGITGTNATNWNLSDSLSAQLIKNPKTIVCQEIEQIAIRSRDTNLSQISSAMKKNKTAIALPLVAKKELIGLIALGNKLNNDSFSTQDINMLESFAVQAAIGIENARLFNQISNFNKTLKEKIRKATLDLAEKNRFLNALRRLDMIIMNTPELKTMCQKIVNMISTETNMQFGILCLIDKANNSLQFSASSQSLSNQQKINPKINTRLNSLSIPLDDQFNLIARAIEEKREQKTTDLNDLTYPALDPQTASILNQQLPVKQFWVYPISAKNKTLGTIIFGLSKQETNLSSIERDIMQGIADQTGIALEKALLYQDLKETIKQLESANRKLKQLDKTKDEFISIASHELRTPLTAINSYLWLMLNRERAKLSKKQINYINKSYISSKRLINLVNDMLSVSRIETSRIQIKLEKIDIIPLIKNVIQELKIKARKNKISLNFQKPHPVQQLVLADKNRIIEVLDNLIGNALKFTPPQGKVWIELKTKGNKVYTYIHDTGRGIAKKDIPKLFKKFGRLEGSYAIVAETPGTGLGLYISKKLINLMGGKINVKSKPGKGSTFSFSLKTAPEDQSGTKSSKNQLKTNRSKKI